MLHLQGFHFKRVFYFYEKNICILFIFIILNGFASGHIDFN